jgi:restriction endonuclease S subunit
VSDVRPGYKWTEVGAIPEVWDVVPIKQVCHLINGRGFKPYEWSDRGLPIIRIQNLNGSDEFNFFEGGYDKKIEIEPGQLLFAWSGSRGTSFGPHIWWGPKAVLNYHTWKLVHDTELIAKSYFLHALRQLTTDIEASAHGASALVHTQKTEMERFLLPLPPYPEQRAIADALGDADALIGALDALTAKKRELKQGAMRELLTGERRLPGFQAEWVKTPLGKVGTLAKGAGVRKDQANSGDLPCVRYGELYTHHRDVIRAFNSHISREVAATAFRLRVGDILFAGSGETKEEIGQCAALIDDIEAFAGGDIVVLPPFDADPAFLGYLMKRLIPELPA